MKYRYRDPTKTPAWIKFGRVGILLLGVHFTGIFIFKRLFGKMDGTSSLTDINANIVDARLKSLGLFHKEAKARHIKMKGLTVVEDKEITMPASKTTE